MVTAHKRCMRTGVLIPLQKGRTQRSVMRPKGGGGGGNQAEETNSQIQTTTGLHMEYKQSCANKL